MATVLTQCTTEEQRAVVRFLWAKGLVAKEIHKEMIQVYAEHCLSRKAVYNWVEKFKNGRTVIDDADKEKKEKKRKNSTNELGGPSPPSLQP